MKKKYIILGSVLILLIGIIFYFSVQQSVIGSIGNIKNSPITKTIDWNGIPVTINSLYLGSVTAGQAGNSRCVNKQNGECLRWATVYFCGATGKGSSAGAYIRNNYVTNNKLTLSSAIGWDGGCGGQNYINSNFELPEGKLILNYNLGAFSTYRDNGQSISQIKLNGKTFSLMCEDHRSDGGRDSQGKPINACTQYGGSNNPTKSGTYTLLLSNKINKVTFGITTQKSYHGSSSASASIQFIPTPLNKTYYELNNNQCLEVNILPSQKTTKDYTTLTECKSHIIAEPVINNSTNINPPKVNFFNKIIAWFLNLFSNL